MISSTAIRDELFKGLELLVSLLEEEFDPL